MLDLYMPGTSLIDQKKHLAGQEATFLPASSDHGRRLAQRWRKFLPEAAHISSPRTPWSAAKARIPAWHRCHETMREDAETYAPASNSTYRIALIGDSIMESWRGTAFCNRMRRCVGLPALLRDSLGSRWPHPLVLAIASDQTQHLLWRLQNGEISESMRRDPRLVAVLLIGTNNLGRGFTADETTSGVLEVVRLLSRMTQATIVLHALLPRADSARSRKAKRARVRAHEDGDSDKHDQDSFMPAVRHVNAQLYNATVWSLLLQERRLYFADCGHLFVAKAEAVDAQLMPDRLHPNVAGFSLWARCLEREIDNAILGRQGRN
mmetsp:Transcript_22363/g.47150  ORF Transcript_22363/g.47150 Transcript_22363/m.47150 type:complete len:322 (-) Transcript_22363:373-1338(-)